MKGDYLGHVYLRSGEMRDKLTFEQITDSMFPLYLVKWDRTGPPDEREMIRHIDGLSTAHLPEDRCIRLVSSDQISFRPLYEVRVDPLIWSHDFANMYGYLIYL